MKELNCLILLSCVSVLSVTEESDVIGSHEPVHVTVGHDVILPCHLEPSYNVTTLTVEWRRNKDIVHIYRNRKDDPGLQNENFRGRTSLFPDELIRGNISLKLTNVTEQDEGNYTCFVPKLDSQVRRGFIKLIVESKLICSQQPLKVLAGYDVILPCHLEPPISVRSETVLWSRSDLKPKYVHYHQEGRLKFEHQDPSYHHHTRLFMDELTNGNVSMKIFKVKMSDAGTFVCSLPSMKKEASVQLIVEPVHVHVTVGHDVILPCHLEPPYDVRTLTVQWRRNKVIVHKYRSMADNLHDQDENFRGRTSLFYDELIRGNISLKLTNVTEQDEGNYHCFVPRLDSQVRRGFIKLIVDPEENRNKGSQTDSDQKKNNNNSYYGFIVLIIIPVIAIAAFFIWKKCGNNNAGRDGRGQHEEVDTDDSRDEGQDPGAGRDGRGQQDWIYMDDSRGECKRKW